MSNTPEPSPRAAFLPVFLGILGSLFFVTILMVLTNGLVLVVGVIAGGLTVMGCVHYLLWGKLLSERTAGEREEAELLERAREDYEALKRTYRH